MTRSAKGTAEKPGSNVRQKAGLNRGILANAWGKLITRLEHKASGRLEKINAAYTSQTCSACGHCASDNREGQAVFRCTACGHQANADVNAAAMMRRKAVSSTLTRDRRRATCSGATSVQSATDQHWEDI